MIGSLIILICILVCYWIVAVELSRGHTCGWGEQYIDNYGGIFISRGAGRYLISSDVLMGKLLTDMLHYDKFKNKCTFQRYGLGHFAYRDFGNDALVDFRSNSTEIVVQVTENVSQLIEDLGSKKGFFRGVKKWA